MVCILKSKTAGDLFLRSREKATHNIINSFFLVTMSTYLSLKYFDSTSTGDRFTSKSHDLT